MKRILLLLAISATANAVLLALYVTKTAAPSASLTDASRRDKAIRSAPAAAGSPADRPNPDRRGQAIDLSDASDLVARMRAAGFPADMIRSAAAARLQEQFNARYAQIMGADQPLPPFWSSEASAFGMITNPERQAAARALNREMTNALRELLGSDFATAGMPEEARASFQRQYGDLPMEKVTQLQEVMRDFSQKQQEAMPPPTGGFSVRLPEDLAKLAQIEQERRAAIVALLTPEELEQYDLRSSSTASQLRSNLVAFEPSEEEYRTIFKLQWEFDQKYPTSTLAGATPDLMRERTQKLQELREQIAAALPPDRADAYRLATEPGASMVARVVSRLELPMSTVGQVVTIQKEIQAQAMALRTDRTLTPDVRNQALAALQQQANERVAGTIGARGLAAYKTSGGAWIQNLVPPPPTPRGGAAPVVMPR